MATLPFAHLNLRHNPFGELPADERAAVAVGNMDQAAAELRAGSAVVLVGPCGRGKTSLLLLLRTLLPEGHHARVPEDGTLPPLPARGIVLVDEHDRLPWHSRARVLGRADGVAVTSHRPLTLPERLWRRGRIVTIAVASADLTRLQAIVDRRIEAARRGPGPVPRVAPETLRLLMTRHGDDVRAIESCLYDQFQEMQEVAHGQV